MDKISTKLNNDMNTNLAAMQKEVKEYVKQLKCERAYFSDIPEELRLNPTIVSVEREMDIRKSLRKGYDVINKKFFVEELFLWGVDYNGKIIVRKETTLFEDFSTYYEFLQGDIYENACYYKYEFSQDEINKHIIDITKINFESLIENNIDSFTLEFSRMEIQQYNEAEKRKVDLKKWIKKFNNCKTYDEFIKTVKNLEKSNFSSELKFFIFNFIYSENENIFNILSQFINENDPDPYKLNLEMVLCVMFNPHDVLKSFDVSMLYSSSTNRNRKNRLKRFIENLENDKIDFTFNSYFDKDSHYFVWHKQGVLKDSRCVEIYRYFETFEELAEYLDNDLTNCDLTKAILPELDLTKYKINEQTKVPIQYQKNLKYDISKKYNRLNNSFLVEQTWRNEHGLSIKNYNHKFKYFFDFVYFLKKDLSNADLLMCDGLQNINDFKGINLSNAKLKSNMLDKIGVKYELVSNSVEEFDNVKSNELQTVNALNFSREELNSNNYEDHKIYYISDLHLLHRLKNAKCRSINDELYVLQKVVDKILNSIGNEEKKIILIGGDTSSDFFHFKLFVRQLRSTIDEMHLKVQVVFVLGNHELWDFKETEFNEIVKKYREVISDNGMYLLQNNIIFKCDKNNIVEISTEDLEMMTKLELLNRLKKARLILFGGIGFSGYNEKFNANQLIYRFAINREKEIEESKKFEKLYNKICDNLVDRRVIIFTHMPLRDWCSINQSMKEFIYVSGHTHRNYFYDDGGYRIYADNQIGYYQENCQLKYFYIEDNYDIFATYEDGIYKISREEYIDFYRGKNIYMDFKRDFYNLYMLKRNGYYMFILQNVKGKLFILNGGTIKGLLNNDVKYYYENMLKVVSHIKTPLNKFSDYQKLISNGIKSIGGNGTIHGAIIDIDFFNHIYVNPIDLTITAYWASDIVNKLVFKDTPTLLQKNLPDMYKKYLKQVENKSKAAIVLKKSSATKSTQFYFNTDIYRASNEIKKMQKLNQNILSIWNEPENKKLKDVD